MSSDTVLADAIVADLNGGSFSLPFTAERQYEPRQELSELAALLVTVVPSGYVLANAARGATQRDIDIDVAVQQKLTAADLAKIDPLRTFTEEIANRLLRLKLFGFSCVAVEHKALWSPEHLKERRTYTSVLTATFRKAA